MEINAGGGVDDNGDELFSIYQGAANGLTQIFDMGLNLQQTAFRDGEKHSLAKLHQWILQKLRDGKSVSMSAFVAYLQEELNKSLPTSQSGSSPNKEETQPGPSSNANPPGQQAQRKDGNTHGSEDAEMEISSGPGIPVINRGRFIA